MYSRVIQLDSPLRQAATPKTSRSTYRRNEPASVKHLNPAWLASVMVGASALSKTAAGWLSSSWMPLGHAQTAAHEKGLARPDQGLLF